MTGPRCGFSLVELAIVLLVTSLLVSGLLAPLAAQSESRKIAETHRSLNEARDALLGYALSFGRLPCPAKDSATGVEAGGGATPCSSGGSGVAVGYLPAATLGLAPSDDQGYLLDAWGARLRYAVSAGPASARNVFTDNNGMRAYWQTQGGPPPASVQICNGAASISHAGASNADCAAAAALTQSAVAVVYSTGRNGPATAGADAAANRDDDRVFVSHDARSAAGGGGGFDDLLLWVPPAILYHHLILAGRLP